MVAILIQTVHVKTKGGHKAEVTAIDPTNYDCIVGTVHCRALGATPVRWNDVGMCRDRDESCNIDMEGDDLLDVLETLRCIEGRRFLSPDPLLLRVSVPP
jgi:hypothetical protein